MHVAFGRVRRKIALLRTSFSLMRNDYLEMVLYGILTVKSKLFVFCCLNGDLWDLVSVSRSTACFYRRGVTP